MMWFVQPVSIRSSSGGERGPESAYPNPTPDKVNIDLSGLSGRKVEVIVTNMQQQQVLLSTLDENHPSNLQLDLGTFSTGTYFVSIISDGEVITKKVVRR